MQRPPSTPARAFLQQAIAFLLLTVLFTALNYMGTAIYELAGGLTTVKPYGGVALALVLILGERWLVPILAAGTLGGVVAKLASSASLADALATPVVTSLTLLAVHLVTRQLIGATPDFRAWRQLVGFIAVAALISAASAFSFITVMEGATSPRFWIDLQAWLIPTALSYVIFTPVMMLLATADRRVL
ncbi:MAG TPA: MASE1 domain-containing protein, partial [Rhizomicrobium sp.]